MSSNLQKWLLTFLLGMLGGAIQCASDTKPQGWDDYMRHMLIGMAAPVAALNITLAKDGKP